MLRKIKFLSVAFVTLLMVTALPAQAGLINLNFDGVVNAVDGGNPFGAILGAPIIASATYDDSALTGVAFETTPLISLNLTSFGFTFALPNFGSLIGTFSSKNLIGFTLLDFVFDSGATPYQVLMTGGPSFDIRDDLGTLVLGGTFDLPTSNNPGGNVPEPASLALFAGGLLGLWGRRQNKVAA